MTPHKALETAILLSGSQRKLAVVMGVSPPTINYWRAHGIPKKYVPELVKLCGNRVTHSDFRPDVNWEFFLRINSNESRTGSATGTETEQERHHAAGHD